MYHQDILHFASITGFRCNAYKSRFSLQLCWSNLDKAYAEKKNETFC